jgi:hypothetical protein
MPQTRRSPKLLEPNRIRLSNRERQTVAGPMELAHYRSLPIHHDLDGKDPRCFSQTSASIDHYALLPQPLLVPRIGEARHTGNSAPAADLQCCQAWAATRGLVIVGTRWAFKPRLSMTALRIVITSTACSGEPLAICRSRSIRSYLGPRSGLAETSRCARR